MTNSDYLSEERINALLDHELSERERLDVYSAIKQDANYSQLFFDLQNNDEIIRFVYSNPPAPRYDPYQIVVGRKRKTLHMLAASLLLLIGVFSGWQLQQLTTNNNSSSILEMNKVDISAVRAEKILLHISNMDSSRINEALDKAEYLLDKENNQPVKVEIVANAEGVDLLRDGSPYSKRLKSLVVKHENVSLKACGIAMQTKMMQEEKDFKLLPEADRVPAALEEILNRIKEGWLYIKA